MKRTSDSGPQPSAVATEGDWVVPFADLRLQAQRLGSRLQSRIANVVASGRYVSGPEVATFEAAAARYLDAAHAVAASSGTDALFVALVALGIERGDEVVTTPFSFFATVEAIVRAGGVPRFVDVDPSTLNLDPRQVLSELGPRTKALLPVHLFGVPADTRALARLAVDRDLALIEDAAQAFGSRLSAFDAARPRGARCYSFFPTKVLGALGDGGLIETHDAETAATCRRLREHGSERRGLHVEIGGNYRLDEVQAAALSVKLDVLDGWIAARRAHATAYDESFRSIGDVRIPDRGPSDAWNAAIYSILVSGGRRDALRRSLDEARIQTAVYYDRPLHLQPALDFLGSAAGHLPVAEQLAREAVALPLYPEMTVSQRGRVIDAVVRFFH